MAEEVLSNALILFGGYNLSGNLNQVALDQSADAPEVTTFGDTTRRRIGGGVIDAALSAQGFVDTPNPDSPLNTALGVAGSIVTVAHVPTDGEVGYSLRAALGEYQPINGAHGEVNQFSLNAGVSNGPVVRGTIMHNNTRTASGNGVTRQLGAVGASQKLYAALHVIAASGTLDIDIESDDNSGMTSATTRASFAQASAIGSEWVEVSGAVTDDYWRIAYTIAGGSPSFQFAVLLGIK